MSVLLAYKTTPDLTSIRFRDAMSLDFVAPINRMAAREPIRRQKWITDLLPRLRSPQCSARTVTHCSG